MVARVAVWPLLRVLRGARQNGSWTELKSLLKERLFPVRHGVKEEGPPPPVLFQMATAYWVSQAIYVAAKLGVADLLQDGPQSSVSLATATGSDPSSLLRLLRALSSAGVFSRVGQDRFALNQLAEPLLSDVPGSLRAILISIGEIHFQACCNLIYSIQTGSPAFNTVFGTTLFDYLEQNSEAAQAFHGGMTNLTSLLAHAVLMAYDFSGISSIVDIGGGEGQLLRRILQANPEMKGIIFDLPRITETASRAWGQGSIAGRLSYIQGNFFDSVPQGADAYLLCNVVHDWDDNHAVAVLRNCRKAMPTTARILLVEMIVPDTNSPSFSKLLDLNMLVMTGGQERTKAEFTALLEAAGFKVRRVIPTLAPHSIIEATPNL